MSNLTIRSACGDDIPAIATIYAEAVETGTASFELVPPDEREMLRRFEALSQGGFPYLVCLEAPEKAGGGEGRVLGYSYAGPYRPRPAYRGTVENSVYVARDARRLGVGRALLTRLIEETTARDFRQMVAVIGDSDNVASIELHRSMGFQMVGTLKNVGRKFDRWLDSVLMQHALGEGADTPPHR
ncbi:GNAT family N-acetyltransferase [Breoghania sp.]|uniref:GNAT family N-acetyltransferase n=1 Tax=Breoghania sp. TaxID=2065378 RepID=UPI00263918B1|nr:GNAT family N-acetyltransferase [Breoghania sp.]MDJ0932608.1 GNAT family N-acetyltransferase [Breoghania sp.]